MSIIEVKDLKKIFYSNFGTKIEALKGVNFSVSEGQVTGYLGPNGAGKTTTFKILTGLVKATSGSCSIQGYPVDKKESRKSLGYLPEGPYFYEHLNAEESLYFYASLFGLKRNKIKNRIDYLLDRFGITYAKNRKLQTYSKGMRQRLGFAQCLINDPEVIILDEPMSGLDPMGRKDFRDMILELRDQGKTILLSSHVMNDVETICSRVILMSKGLIREEGEINDLLQKTASGTEIIFKANGFVYESLLERFEAKILTAKDSVVIFVPNQEKAQELIGLLIQNRCLVVKVLPHCQSLEEYFFKLSKEN